VTISIPADFGPFVEELVATGAYPTPEAVVTEALRRLQEDQAKIAELRSSLAEAVAELDRGEGTPLDFDEIKRQGRERLLAKRG
jgi:putative addiction module CopG family antidote